MSTCTWQQILALDARYNAYRAPNDPSFRSLYIRRRSQLLREYASKKQRCSNTDFSSFQHDYLVKRSELLAERYGCVPASEGSIRSRSQSIRSNSQLTIEGDNESARKQIIHSTNKSTIQSALPRHEGYEFENAYQKLDHHKDSITRIKFAHDEACRVAIASMDSTISICNIASVTSCDKKQVNGKPTVLNLIGHKQGVIDIVWSISNDLLLSCSLDATLRLWDPSTGECIRIIEDSCPILCCLFQPINNNLVVTGNVKGLVQVLNISTGKYLKTGTCKMTGSAVCMCCETAGRLLWVGDDKGTILSFLMDATLGKLVKGRKIFISNNCPITSLSCRPWGNANNNKQPLILINSASNTLYVYTVCDSNGMLQPVRKIPLHHRRLTIHSTFCPLVSSKQGAFAASGSEDGLVYLFDVERSDRSNDVKLKGHQSAVIDVSFNHDETFLVSGDSKGLTLVWKRIIKKENAG